jgi:hypothetical protein
VSIGKFGCTTVSDFSGSGAAICGGSIGNVGIEVGLPTLMCVWFPKFFNDHPINAPAGFLLGRLNGQPSWPSELNSRI